MLIPGWFIKKMNKTKKKHSYQPFFLLLSINCVVVFLYKTLIISYRVMLNYPSEEKKLCYDYYFVQILMMWSSVLQLVYSFGSRVRRFPIWFITWPQT
uniref:Uncharacterized protein n=1 Tax=Lepeophtheirus salmonis TaxID=72036 RepID=A0A0K2U2B3_LEPSM